MIDKIISAMYSDDFEEITNLKENGFDFDEKDEEGRSIIFHAIIEQKEEFLKKLLNEGVKVNIKDEQGWTPLHYAVQEYSLESVRLLIDHGADVNAKDNFGNTIIWRAVFSSKGKGEVINFLKLNNADFNLKNDSGISALDLANNIGNYDVIQFFS